MSTTKKLFLSALMGVFLWLAQPAAAQVKINEFVADANPEWVEFYNASDSAEYLKTYWLDDDQDFSSDAGSSSIKLLSNLNTAAVTYPFIEISSFLNNGGDWVVLFDNLGNKIDEYHYDQSPGSNVSIGRSPDQTGNWFILEETTQGRQNNNPLPSPQPNPSPSPSPTPTPAPSPTPSPSPTPKLSPKPSPVPSPKPAASLEPLTLETTTPSGEVLGSTQAAELKKKNPYWLAIILIGLGLGLLGSVAVAAVRAARYNQTNDSSGKT